MTRAVAEDLIILDGCTFMYSDESGDVRRTTPRASSTRT